MHTVNSLPPILVLDIGGTKLAAGLLTADNTIANRQETATLAHEGGAVVVARLITLAQRVVHASPVAPIAVGVSSAGQMDRATGNVIFATDNLPAFTGFPLGAQLERALGLPVFTENDANCFALAEATLGAGRGYANVLVVAVGTGVGGGIVINNELYSGWRGNAGKVGHLCVEPNGRACTCGQLGCLESYAATRIMVAESGYPTIHALATDYATGMVIPAVDQAAQWLGIGLASLAHVLGPEAIVIGGSVGLLGERYLASVRAGFISHAMPAHRATPILASTLAADSGLAGAGLLARQQLYPQINAD